jgi:hypothetical protein
MRVLNGSAHHVVYAPRTQEFVNEGGAWALLERSSESGRNATRLEDPSFQVRAVLAVSANASAELVVVYGLPKSDSPSVPPETRVVLVGAAGARLLPGALLPPWETPYSLAVCGAKDQFGVVWVSREDSSENPWVTRFVRISSAGSALDPGADRIISRSAEATEWACAANGETYLLRESATEQRTTLVRASDGAFVQGVDPATQLPNWTYLPLKGRAVAVFPEGSAYRVASPLDGWTCHLDGDTGELGAAQRPFPQYEHLGSGSVPTLSLGPNGGVLLAGAVYGARTLGESLAFGAPVLVGAAFQWLDPKVKAGDVSAAWSSQGAAVAYSEGTLPTVLKMAWIANGADAVAARCELPLGSKLVSTGPRLVAIWKQDAAYNGRFVDGCRLTEPVVLSSDSEQDWSFQAACHGGQCWLALGDGELKLSRLDAETLSATRMPAVDVPAFPYLVSTSESGPRLIWRSPSELLHVAKLDGSAEETLSVPADVAFEMGLLSEVTGTLLEERAGGREKAFRRLALSPLAWTEPWSPPLPIGDDEWLLSTAFGGRLAVLERSVVAHRIRLHRLGKDGRWLPPDSVLENASFTSSAAAKSPSGRLLVAYARFEPTLMADAVYYRILDPDVASAAGGAGGAGGATPEKPTVDRPHPDGGRAGEDSSSGSRDSAGGGPESTHDEPPTNCACGLIGRRSSGGGVAYGAWALGALGLGALRSRRRRKRASAFERKPFTEGQAALR